MTKWWGNETEKLRSFLFLVGKLSKTEKLKKLKQKNKIKAEMFFLVGVLMLQTVLKQILRSVK